MVWNIVIPLTAACVSIVTVTILVIYTRLEQRKGVHEITENFHEQLLDTEGKLGTNGK